VEGIPKTISVFEAILEADVHKKTTYPLLWRAMRFSLVLSVMCVFGGAVAIIVGLYRFPAQATTMSAAVSSTLVLSLIYVAVYMLHKAWHLWVHFMGKNPMSYSRGTRVLARASLVAEKAPVMAALFLTARLRALQLDPPHGMPEPWAQKCFHVTVWFFLVEIVMEAGIVAWSPSRSEISDSAVPPPTCMATLTSLHILYTISSLCVFAGVVASLVSVYGQMAGRRRYEAPLSTTTTSVLILVEIFFAVHFLRLFVQLCHFVLKAPLSRARRAFNNAAMGVSLCPSLCFLFLAARLRALQISDGHGSPIGWGQAGMVLCVVAMCLKVFCLIIVPVATNQSEVDSEGHTEYQSEPLIGAYSIAISKYLALFCLYFGVISVIVSIAKMQDATVQISPQAFHELPDVIWTVCMAAAIVVLALIVPCAKMGGLVVKLFIQSVDRPLLGTDIKVGKALLSVWRGYVHVANVVMLNPLGHQWETDNLVVVEEIVIHVHMRKLIFSGFKEIEILCVRLHGVEVTFEKPPNRNSNILTQLNFIDENAMLNIMAAVANKVCKPVCMPIANAALKLKDLLIRRRTLTATVRQVSIRGITGIAMVRGSKKFLKLADIEYADFHADVMEKGNMANGVYDVTIALMVTFFRTALANMPAAELEAVQCSLPKVLGQDQCSARSSSSLSKCLPCK